ncbi:MULTISPECIES: serine/threonine-protein kinase [Nocardia]|uniref:serine/threonine-protein kinase n=1 Tax=Nocardia TaxID=1817 RepID=UPI000D68DF26|nr:MULTISPECIES: serine/threonine-protein kinase [Nocardia]
MQPLGMDDPRRIGDYRLLGVLGSGGMGRVYLGRNAGGRTVAVKVIRPDLIGDGEFRMRFRREVTAARRVDGRFTAPVLDADVDANPPWLATGYVAGFSLSEAVERFGTFTEDAVKVLARGLAEALAAIHGAGVVHRDLKPSNVLLALDGPKVIDFGIARAVEDTALTTTGKVIGSPGFMCPEQVTGEPVVPASDIFALGGILVFAATGHGPFGTGDTVHMLWRVVYEEPRLDAVPERLRPLIASCLSKDVAARPTPRQLMEQLDLLGMPEDGGWLPSPVVHEVSRRAVQLLDLDSGPHDLPPEIRSHSPATGSVSFTPPPTARTPYTAPSRQYERFGPGGDPSAPGRHEPTRHNTPAPSSGWQTPQGSTQPGSMPQPGRYVDAVSAPPPSPPKNRTRAALIAGLLVVAIAVAFGAFFIGTRLHNDSKDSADSSETSTEEYTDTESTDTTEPESTSASSDTEVPQAFLGSWRGTAKDAVFTFDIEVVLGEGGIGDEVGESSNTGKLAGARCVRAERLNSANETEIVLTARLTENGGGCIDDGSESTLTLQADGSLSYTTSGLAGNMAGVLRKVQ